MNRKTIISISIGLFIGLFAFTGLIGCDGSSEIIDPPTINNYQISGLLVKDLNTGPTFDSTIIALNLYHNDTLMTVADISFFGQDLAYGLAPRQCNQAFVFPVRSQDLMPPGNYFINIIDRDLYNDSIAVTVVDTFHISAYNPDSLTVNVGGTAVNIEWSSSSNIEGYIIAVTPADSVYTRYGYSAYVTTLADQATIPPDAFRTPDFANQLVTGIYHLYIYAYTGAPDSSMACQLLPVPLPSQLPNNIDQSDMTGNFGTVVITKRVPLLVTAS